MLRYVELFQEDPELYNSFPDINRIIVLSRILDQVNSVEQTKLVTDIRNYIVVELNSVPNIEAIHSYFHNDAASVPSYFLIKDDICYIGESWELSLNAPAGMDRFEWWKSKGYLVSKIGEEKTSVVRCSNGNEFKSIVDAAQWCIDSGKSKGTCKRAIAQIRASVEKGVKAYGYTWSVEDKPIEYNYSVVKSLDEVNV